MGSSITVALLGSTEELARELGKKGTQSDVTLYNSVRDGHAATLVLPTQFPEKLAPLLFALSMADRAVLIIEALDRRFAETVATLDLMRIPVDLFLGTDVGEDEFRRVVRGTRLETLPVRPLDSRTLRTDIEHWTAAQLDGPVQVPIDHAFPVKGVGTVALGIVRRGQLTEHDKLRLYPADLDVEIRSIQVHDVEVRAAKCGERVGIALKSIEAAGVTRGQVLAPPGSTNVDTLVNLSSVQKSPHYRGRIEAGNSLQLNIGLQMVPARVESVSGAEVSVRTERPVATGDSDLGLLADLSVGQGSRAVLSGQVRLGTV